MRIPLGALLLAASAPLASAQNILVFEEITNHQFATQAAQNISPGGTVVATSVNFSSLLAAGPWDVVIVDCPTCCPPWADLMSFIQGGGRVVMSFWDWDNSSLCGDPLLPGAFDVAVVASISLDTAVLSDLGTSSVFNSVTMPNATWHDHWVDDGDQFTPQGTAVGLAHSGDPAKPVFVLGNDGRTIAAPLIDVAGNDWLNDGSALRLWENLIGEVIGGLPASASVYGCGLNPPGSMSVVSGLPSLGTSFTLGLDNPLGTQALGSFPFLVLAFAPDANFPCGTPVPNLGMQGGGVPGELLVSLAPPTPIAPIQLGAAWTGPGMPAPFILSVPNDPSLLGVSIYGQGLLLDPSVAFGVRFGLTDAVRLRVGP